ncbi:MAG: thioredoxin, partial [Bacteroidota bacterium]
MKRLIFISAAIAGLSFLLGATFTPNPEPVKEEVNWVSMEEAATLAAQDGKKIMVDLYTGWCGWCKRMDATTYGNKE